jgi:hypothetical protein
MYRIGITFVSSGYDITSCSQLLKSFILGEHGIPEGPDHIIQLLDKSYRNLFHGASNIYMELATDIMLVFYLDYIPVHAKALYISIDPTKAMALGVKFFHTKESQLIATGDWNRAIPFNALESVVELEITKELLR